MNMKRKRTCQYSLTLALDYILRNSIATKSKLRNNYALDPKTMLKIEAGGELSPSAHRHYLETFVGIINCHRMLHPECEVRLNKLLADIMLVECGIRTDEERIADFEEEKRAVFQKTN